LLGLRGHGVTLRRPPRAAIRALHPRGSVETRRIVRPTVERGSPPVTTAATAPSVSTRARSSEPERCAGRRVEATRRRRGGADVDGGGVGAAVTTGIGHFP
jgi:hypothetical protein